MRRTLLCAALLAACLAANAREDKDREAQTDQTFVTKASASDLAEINVSRIAVKNASDSDVKKFAQKMIEDHTKTSKELLELADKKKLTAAKSMDDEHEKLSRKLLGLKGADFDKAYVEGQVKDHEVAVALFEKQSKDGKDDDLKAWAKKTLPHLKHHLKMARELHKKLAGDRDK